MNKAKVGLIALSQAAAMQAAVQHAAEQRRAEGPLTNGDLSRRVEALVRDTTMSYTDIVATVREEFPHAQTSTKSVASVACCMRKKGIAVPLRLKLNIVA